MRDGCEYLGEQCCPCDRGPKVGWCLAGSWQQDRVRGGAWEVMEGLVGYGKAFVLYSE